MKFKAALFDLDGTLLDTLDDLGDSTNTVLKQSGFPEHEIPAYRYFIGDGFEKLIQRALPQNSRNGATVKRLVDELKVYYDHHWADKTRPYDGIPALLDRISARGMKMAVLSNKPDGPARQVVAHFFSQWRFEVVLGSRPGVPNKPHPASAVEIAKALDIPPEEFLYFGDTGIDMQTAAAANMYAVGVLWGFRKADEILESGARMLVGAPEDLTVWL